MAKHISELDQIDKWLNNLIKLIKRSKYHTGHLLKQRANRYNNKTVFNLIREGQLKTISYSSLWSSVIEVGRALSTFANELNKPVSIGLLTHNQLNGVLVDLACLSFGFRVIPIPLNATPEHISYILEHGEITNIFIGGKAGVRLWNELQDTRSIEVVTLDNNESLKGDDLKTNSQILKSLLNGEGNKYHKEVVALNTALVLWVSGSEDDLSLGVKRSLDCLNTDKSWLLFDQLRDFLSI